MGGTNVGLPSVPFAVLHRGDSDAGDHSGKVLLSEQVRVNPWRARGLVGPAWLRLSLPHEGGDQENANREGGERGEEVDLDAQ